MYSRSAGAELNFAGLPYSAVRLMRHGCRRAVVREHDPLYSACRVDEQAAGRLILAAGLPESRRCLRIGSACRDRRQSRGLLWAAVAVLSEQQAAKWWIASAIPGQPSGD